MALGTVKFFDDTHGYDFITPDGGGADIPAHTSDLGGPHLQSLVVNNQISSIAGALNINLGADATQSGGSVTLNNALTTNGGNINFYKPVGLASTTPISTKITEASSAQSGNVSFYQDVTLAAPGYAVTINAQGPQSAANFTGRGGNIDVKGNIVSGTYLVQYSQSLTLDTTGADASTPSGGPARSPSAPRRPTTWAAPAPPASRA